MDNALDRNGIKELFNNMWRDSDYKRTLKSAVDSSVNFSPMLSKVANAVNIHLGGSLGMRSTRKQLQGIMHHVCGNLELRINSTSTVPSTFFLPICAYIGSGKSIYYGFLKRLMGMLQEQTEIIDMQIFDSKKADEPSIEGQEGDKKAVIAFKPRQLLYGPGSKEG